MAKTYIEVATQSDLTDVTETVTTLSETVDTLTTSVDGTDDTDGLVNEVSDLEDRVETLEDEADSHITVTAIYDTNTSLSTITDDGYYIWTSEPADLSTYLSSGTANDIWECSSSVWSTYLAYDSCAATIAVSAESDGEITYMKSEGSWVEAGTGSSTSVEITAIYDDNTNVATVTTEGYYIWTALPSDSDTIDSYSANDIAYYDGVNWELYSTYSTSPASIYNLDDTYTYEKVESGWAIGTASLNEVSRELDYAVFSLATSITTTGVGTYIPFDTEVITNGDVSLGDNGVNLIGGRTYRLFFSPYINNMSSTNLTLMFYNYTTSEEISPSKYFLAFDTSADAGGDNSLITIYTPESDCEICIYCSSSSTGNFYNTRGNVLTVEEIPSQVTSYLDADAVEVTNNDTATENQLLISNGDETATFTDIDDLGILTYNSTAQTIDCDDMTDAGIYAITISSSNLPDSINTAANYLVLQVYTYGSSNGVQILRSADYDSSTAIACEWERSWENSNFTNWFVHTKVNDANTITANEVMVAADTHGNMQTGITAKVSGDLSVTGDATLSGANTLSGTTKVSGALTLSGNFGAVNTSLSKTYNSTSTPSSSSTCNISTISSYSTLSTISVAKLPLGNGRALVIITGAWSTYTRDQAVTIRFAADTFTTYLGCTCSFYSLSSQESSDLGDFSVMPSGGKNYLTFNRDDDMNDSTPFNFIAICYDSGYTTGSLV